MLVAPLVLAANVPVGNAAPASEDERTGAAPAVEFDLAEPFAATRPGAAPGPSDPKLSRITFYQVDASGNPGAAIYSEQLGYLRGGSGAVHVRVGVADPEGFRIAFGLGEAPDANWFSQPLWVSLETCRKVIRQGDADRCDLESNPAWTVWLATRLDAAPIAQSVLSVPLSALPDEVILEDELEQALAAERRAWQDAVAAVEANLALETARAKAEEARLSGALQEERRARQTADDLERQARSAEDAAINSELAAVEARRVADSSALHSALQTEIGERVAADQAVIDIAGEQARGAANALGSALATPGGAQVAWENITGRPTTSVQLVTSIESTWVTVLSTGCLIPGLCGDKGRVTGSVFCPNGTAVLACTVDRTVALSSGPSLTEVDGQRGCTVTYDGDLFSPTRAGVPSIALLSASCMGIQ